MITIDQIKSDISSKEHVITCFVNEWQYNDPKLIDWKARGKLLKLLDEWHLLWDQLEAA